MQQLYIPVVHGAALERPDEADTIATAHSVSASLRRTGHLSDIIWLSPDLGALDALARRRPALVFNLVEALGGEAAEALRAMERLEQLGLTYTGATASAFRASNSKLDSKVRFANEGLPTPAYWSAADDIPPDATLIIKSVEEHGSLGMDQGSIVRGTEAKREMACRAAEFGGCFFGEAYVDGREFNVSVLQTASGPVVLPIAEIDFSALPAGQQAIVDFATKWDPDAPAYNLTPRVFGLEEREPVLAAEIRRLSLSCWHAFAMSGYTRVDFRVDGTGRPWVLEVNANPCLAPDAGFAAAAAQAGYAYDDLVAAIVSAAIEPASQVA